jgi:hypothetical protein
MEKKKTGKLRIDLAPGWEKEVAEFADRLGMDVWEARKLLRARNGTTALLDGVRARLEVPEGATPEAYANSLAELTMSRDGMKKLVGELGFSQVSLGSAYLQLSEARSMIEQGYVVGALAALVGGAGSILHGVSTGQEEGKSKSGRKAADARHASSRATKAKAKTFFESRPWRTKADAKRAIAKEFHVEFPTADGWVTQWTKM